jgi:hypothetical protein
MKQTPRNEKRAPKATAGPSVFGLLSVRLLHFLFCLAFPRSLSPSSLEEIASGLQ